MSQRRIAIGRRKTLKEMWKKKKILPCELWTKRKRWLRITRGLFHVVNILLLAGGRIQGNIKRWTVEKWTEKLLHSNCACDLLPSENELKRKAHDVERVRTNWHELHWCQIFLLAENAKGRGTYQRWSSVDNWFSNGLHNSASLEDEDKLKEDALETKEKLTGTIVNGVWIDYRNVMQTYPKMKLHECEGFSRLQL